jgi:hypothetical protein
MVYWWEIFRKAQNEQGKARWKRCLCVSGTVVIFCAQDIMTASYFIGEALAVTVSVLRHLCLDIDNWKFKDSARISGVNWGKT